MKKQTPRRSPGFTLIELLVVMGIIVLIGAMVVPAVGGSLKGTALNQATQTVLSQFNNAQQVAIAKGQTMELRLYLMPNPESAPADSQAALRIVCRTHRSPKWRFYPTASSSIAEPRCPRFVTRTYRFTETTRG